MTRLGHLTTTCAIRTLRFGSRVLLLIGDEMAVERGVLSSRRTLFATLIAAAALASPIAAGANTGQPIDGLASPTAAAAAPAPPDRADAERLLQSERAALGDRFAGAWVDDRTGSVDVALKAGSDLLALSPKLAAQRTIQVVPAKFSTSELDKAMTEVTTRLNALLAPKLTPGSSDGGAWPYEAEVNIRANTIDVTLDSALVDKIGEVRSAIGDLASSGLVRLVGDRAVRQQQAACSSRTNCFPVRGGVQAIADAPCTLNFEVRDARGVLFLVTAGHCTGSTYVHFFQNIAIQGNYVHGSSYVDDAKVLAVRYWQPQPTNWIYRNAGNATPITSKVTSPDAGLVGNQVCQDGYNNEGCGGLTSYNATFLGVANQGKFSGQSCLGDSGGPVVNSSTNRAYGILRGFTGSGSCGSVSYFSWTAYFESGSAAAGHPYQLLLGPSSESLGPEMRLAPGQQIVSPNGAYNLVMQGDGNLVRYGAGTIWASGTDGHPGAFAVMQGDGNFVVYDANQNPLWWTGTQGNNESYVTIQSDANVVIYKANGGYSWCIC